MSYVIVHGGGLSGLIAPTLGAAPVRGVGGKALGEGPASHASRSQIQALFEEMAAKWRVELTKAIDDVPIIHRLRPNISSARGFIKDARDKLDSEVLPIGIAVINDTSIPLVEVEKRVSEFSVGYYEGLVAQMQILEQAAKAQTMRGQLDTFRDALRRVVRDAAQEAGQLVRELAKGLMPGWLLPAGVLLVGVVVWGALRR